MFVSANFLSINYGVDDKIAKFFVDREPPADNLYWKDKLMYLRPEVGWLFIPLIADLLFKAGISRDQLLSEDFVSLMEKIGHISAQHELKLISDEEQLKALTALVDKTYQSEAYLKNLIDFMHGGSDNPFSSIAPPFKALHRGNAFLFAICALKFDDALQAKLVENWFALISILLLLDDAEDMEIDKQTCDENAFIESGLDKDGIERIKEFVAKNLRFISSVNMSMAATLDQKFLSISYSNKIQQLLNQ